MRTRSSSNCTKRHSLSVRIPRLSIGIHCLTRVPHLACGATTDHSSSLTAGEELRTRTRHSVTARGILTRCNERMSPPNECIHGWHGSCMIKCEDSTQRQCELPIPPLCSVSFQRVSRRGYDVIRNVSQTFRRPRASDGIAT